MEANRFVRAKIFVVLCATLLASGMSVQADDTPAQAAARAALEQKLYQLNQPNVPPSTETNASATAESPTESTTNATGATSITIVPRTEVPATVVPGETASAPTVPAKAVLVPVVPDTNTPAQAAALAALNQKMYELNHPAAETPPNTNPAATPVTETPAAEVPVAATPAVAPASVVSLSAAPAVATPAASAANVPVAAPIAALHAPILPPSSSTQTRPANELATTTGVIYKNVEVERVENDGIVISYTPASGGWAMTKIYFQDLPPEIRQQYEKQ